MDMMNVGGVMSSEDSSCPDESDSVTELELGLGLSLGCSNCKSKSSSSCTTTTTATTLRRAKFQESHHSSSSSNSSTLSRVHATAGTKRTADSSSQVVGWPPLRAHRMNSMANQTHSTASERYGAIVGKSKHENIMVEKHSNNNDKNNVDAGGRGQLKSSMFLKVNMDGCPIGRKIDLSAHGSYEKLAETLEDMFLGHTTDINSSSFGSKERDSLQWTKRSSKLLDGSFDYVLTYEDKEGDWMMVGDVPWGMFINCVKRLRIMKTSEANGLDPKVQENNAGARQQTHLVSLPKVQERS